MSQSLLRLSLVVTAFAPVVVALNAASAQAQSAPVEVKAYADKVIDYQRGTSRNWERYFGEADDLERWQVYDPESALGVANWTSEMTQRGSLGQWDKEIGVSLGNGGSLIVEFTDNALTGSGNSDSDLWIFEIGGVAEKTFVEISQDGQSWYDIGIANRQDKSFDSGVGIDIDGLLASNADLDLNSIFSFVRVTDTGTNKYRNFKAGADIDAIAALSSVPKEPEDVPESSLLLGVGLFGLLVWRQRFRVA